MSTIDRENAGKPAPEAVQPKAGRKPTKTARPDLFVSQHFKRIEPNGAVSRAQDSQEGDSGQKNRADEEHAGIMGLDPK